MPAVEASSYELAFHVLPTVAEGEVSTIVKGLKDLVAKLGGEVTNEEAPARFDLAYEIVKYLEGRNRKFTSAYFGWIRFSIDPAQAEEIGSTVLANKAILRHLLTRLTKVEETNPFFFHEALEKDSSVKKGDHGENEKASDSSDEDKDDSKEKGENSEETEENKG